MAEELREKHKRAENSDTDAVAYVTKQTNNPSPREE
jgi:hypothetical protein